MTVTTNPIFDNAGVADADAAEYELMFMYPDITSDHNDEMVGLTGPAVESSAAWQRLLRLPLVGLLSQGKLSLRLAKCKKVRCCVCVVVHPLVLPLVRLCLDLDLDLTRPALRTSRLLILLLVDVFLRLTEKAVADVLLLLLLMLLLLLLLRLILMLLTLLWRLIRKGTRMQMLPFRKSKQVSNI